MLTYQIASSMHFIMNSDLSPDRELHARRAERTMDDYEEALFGLKNGSVKLMLEPLHENDLPSQASLNELIRLWKDEQRPLLRDLLRRSDARNVKNCDACHAVLRANIVKIESLVKNIEKHHDRELADYNRYRIYWLIALIFMAGALFVYARRSLIMPAQQLKNAAEEIEKGDFDVSVGVSSRDEIGRLAISFNSMAQRLKALFSEQKEHLHEMNMLNEIARVASQSLNLDIMLGRVMDAILRLPAFSRVGKGAVFLADADNGVLRLAAAHNYPDAQQEMCGVLRPGECLCGLCYKEGEAVLTQQSLQDERHVKTYPDMKDHGHAILPLKSRSRIIGVMCFYLPAGAALLPNELKLYSSIADIVAVSVQNAVNHRQVAMLAQSLDSSMDLHHYGWGGYHTARQSPGGEIPRLFTERAQGQARFAYADQAGRPANVGGHHQPDPGGRQMAGRGRHCAEERARISGAHIYIAGELREQRGHCADRHCA